MKYIDMEGIQNLVKQDFQAIEMTPEHTVFEAIFSK